MLSDSFLSYLTVLAETGGQIEHVEHIAERNPEYGALRQPLPEALDDALKANHTWPLFTHQAEAVNYIRSGLHTVVATSSSSGKSLAYNIPVLEALSQDASKKALYLFPTKALARDQLKALEKLTASPGLKNISAATCDGDTPLENRDAARQRAGIVITNPDMLHYSILPNHGQWSRFLSGLKFVILDEAHVYRGVFGSHVSLVIRRLRRICRYYGSSPLFVLCSATISNPEEHSQGLTGLDFKVVTRDGSGVGQREFIFWNPPLKDVKKGTRKSTNAETAMLVSECINHDIATLAFTRTRRLTELVFNYARDRLKHINPAKAELIKPYRAGYLPEVRRGIELDLAAGKLKGVISTNALELGIDIGTLDATIMAGYPGTISSTWQQAGRSGRRGRRALSILVGRDDPLDQYFMHYPQSFFSRQAENALINPQNEYILKNHLVCAAWEQPLKTMDGQLFGPAFHECLNKLEFEGKIKKRGERWYTCSTVENPARKVDIRSASGSTISVIDVSTGTLIDSIEHSTALFQAHPGAIYLNQGETYLIQELDLRTAIASASPVEASYYTMADDLTNLRIIKVIRSLQRNGFEVSFGTVEVTTSVIAFKRKEQFTEAVIDQQPLDLPETVFVTAAVWFEVPEEINTGLTQKGLDFAGGLHAAEHAAISILPLFAMCDRADIGGVSTTRHPDTGKPQVFIYDACPGGIGIAEKGFELIVSLWDATLRLIRLCPCEEGCPSCIQSPKCGNNNQPLDKKAAVEIFQRLTG